MSPQQASTDALAAEVSARASSQVVPSGQVTVIERFKQEEGRFAEGLPANTVALERFMRSCITAVRATPKLLECSQASVLGAVTVAASLGLEFGQLGLAYLVPFKNHGRMEAQLIVGYKGIIELARRSGGIKDIGAYEVYEADEFDFYRDGDGDHLHHRPKWKGDRGPITHYYGHVIYTNGGHHVQIMSLEDINARRARSQTANSNYSPWKTNEIEMSRKSCIHAMKPWLPLTPEIAEHLATGDERIVTLEAPRSGVPAELVPGPVATAAEPPDLSDGPTAREKADERLSAAMAGLEPAQRTALGNHLIDTYGPWADIPDDKIEEVLTVAANWPPPGPPGPTGAPVGGTGQGVQAASPGPAEGEVGPQGVDPDPQVPLDPAKAWLGAVGAPVPPHIEEAVEEEVRALKAPDVSATLSAMGLPAAGKVMELRVELKIALAKRKLAEEGPSEKEPEEGEAAPAGEPPSFGHSTEPFE